MVESKLVINCLEYNPDIYENIIQHGRLAPVDLEKLRVLSRKEVEDFDTIRCLTKILSFSSNQILDTKDIERILRVHTPLDANAYHEEIRNEHHTILNLDFYKI